ncbi:zinc transporter ZIP6-like [Protopterus annectens]|uniref:zinc transporter ZIP6-like n=1 Tax=Protopterus annectens TaxID=7888 RepID=UPI001CFAB112|nr:zinc transporter ZIP6-like [Protopterus annectens]
MTINKQMKVLVFSDLFVRFLVVTVEAFGELPPPLQTEELRVGNPQLAVLTQRSHLQQLFDRFGENGSLTTDGLRRMLHSIGIDKIRGKDHGVAREHENCSEAKEEHIDDHKALHTHLHSGEERAPHGDPTREKQMKRGAPKIENVPNDIDSHPKNAPVEVKTTPVYTTASFLKSRTGQQLSKSVGVIQQSSKSSKSTVVSPQANLSLAESGVSGSMVIPKKKPDEPSFQSSVFGYTDKELHMAFRHVDHGHDDEHQENKCLNASVMLLSHGMIPPVDLTPTEFSYLCPALLNQIVSKSCFVQKSDHHPEETHSFKTAWIGGFASITIISALSLIGVLLIPLMNKVFFKFLLCFLVALAVGTLSGDAFLHLIPHAQGTHHHQQHNHPHHHHHLNHDHHHHSHESHYHSENSEEHSYMDSVWKGLTALGGVYFMFLIEHFLTLIKVFKDKQQKKNIDIVDDDIDTTKRLSEYEAQQLTKEKMNPGVDVDHESSLTNDCQDQMEFRNKQATIPEEEAMITPLEPDEYSSRDCENKCHSHFHDTLGQPDDLIHRHHDYHHILHHHHHQNHHPHSHCQQYSHEELKGAGIAALAWMVIVRDGLHNFSDGLAIGFNEFTVSEDLYSEVSDQGLELVTNDALLCTSSFKVVEGPILFLCFHITVSHLSSVML